MRRKGSRPSLRMQILELPQVQCVCVWPGRLPGCSNWIETPPLRLWQPENNNDAVLLTSHCPAVQQQPNTGVKLSFFFSPCSCFIFFFFFLLLHFDDSVKSKKARTRPGKSKHSLTYFWNYKLFDWQDGTLVECIRLVVFSL